MRLNSEKRDKVLKDVSDIADYYRQTRNTQKLNLIVSALYNLLILLFIIGTIVSVVKSGTIESIFGEAKDLQRRFDCVSSSVNDSVKSYQEAQLFTQMFGGKCQLKGG